MSGSGIEGRIKSFCSDYNLTLPILMAPMAGACPTALAAGVANAGGMGACGALLMEPDAISDWCRQLRSASNGAFQLNVWIPDPEPARDREHEQQIRTFLAQWGPEVSDDAVDQPKPSFEAQVGAMIAAGPPVISSIMGLYPPDIVAEAKRKGLRWFATVTTVEEARLAVAAGADAVVAQGMEAGGHRGAFEAENAASRLVGLFSLLPAVADAVDVPVIATGGIADGRGIAAALALGASAVQIGTGLLRTPEAGISRVWAAALAGTNPEDTIPTRGYSGRLGRCIRNRYIDAVAAPDTPDPVPYPIQSALTRGMRSAAAAEGKIDVMQAWAGQSARLAQDRPVGDLVRDLWCDAQRLLGWETKHDGGGCGA